MHISDGAVHVRKAVGKANRVSDSGGRGRLGLFRIVISDIGPISAKKTKTSSKKKKNQSILIHELVTGRWRYYCC